MGRTYGVPRSAKGESRILYIFTIKSLAITLIFGAFAWLLVSLIEMIVSVSLILKLIIIGIFGGIGFVIGAANIPDNPIMGPLQKAGGEQILNILMRLITFKGKKKIYIYGLNRDISKDKENSSQVNNVIKLIKNK